MGSFFIQPVDEPNIFFELSATTDISLTVGSSVTSYPIESGFDVSDNVILTPKKAQITGVITDVYQTGFQPVDIRSSIDTTNSTQFIEDFIRELTKRINEKKQFNVFATDRVEPLTNCIVTSFSLSKGNTLGGDSWRVSLDLQQVRTASRARVVPTVDADFSKLLAAKKKASQNSADVNGKQEEAANYGFFLSNSGAEQTQRAQEKQYDLSGE